MFRSPSTTLLFSGLFGLMVLFTGCDMIAEQVGLDEVDVSTPSELRNVAVVAGDSTSAKSTFDAGANDLPDVFDVEAIEFKKENITFTPNPGKNDQSGRIIYGFTIDGYPIDALVIEVVDNEVTEVTPSTINIKEYSAGGVDAEYHDLFETLLGPLAPDWKSAGTSELNDVIEAGLEGTMKLGILVDSDVSGRFSVDQMTFHLDY